MGPYYRLTLSVSHLQNIVDAMDYILSDLEAGNQWEEAQKMRHTRTQVLHQLQEQGLDFVEEEQPGEVGE